jgi:hypothetical protein
MEVIHISASHPQLLKLRKGHKIRVKPAMKGQGIPLIVLPNTFNQYTKSFASNKGFDISLTPNEIFNNKEQTDHPEIQGQGIFGRRFDRAVRKTIGKHAQDVIYKGADLAKPYIKQTISKVGEYIPQAGEQIGLAVANASGHPEVAGMLGELGKRAGSAIQQEGTQRLENYLDNPHGRGLHFTKYHHPHLHHQHEVGIVGIGGTLLHRRHSARLSNPYLEHKLQNKELPIQYQRIHHTAGNGLGVGLYL